MLPSGYDTDTVVQLESNLDDVSPEVVAFVAEKLRELGALDVWITPIQMKKHRPGMMLSALCLPEKVELLSDIFFRETGAFGLRITEVRRLKLRRDFITVETEFGPITVKRGFRGDSLIQQVPEYESCRKISVSTGTPLQSVYNAAKQAANALL